MNGTESPPDRFRSVVAVLIALVTLFGALLSWRVAIALGAAGGADTAGLLAAVAKEDVATFAAIAFTEHRAAYSSYIENDTLSNAYDALAQGNPTRTDLAHYSSVFHYASHQAQSAIPQAYINRAGSLDAERDIGEHVAEASRNKDVEPEAHYAQADAKRQKAMVQMGAIVALGLVLILLTLADAVQHPVRYLLLVSGLLLFGATGLVSMAVELLGALGIMG